MSKVKDRSVGKPTAPGVETVAVGDLHIDPSNLRRHPEKNIDAIKASLARFGQQKPIVIDAGNVVRAGNGTLEAARALGWGTVQCVRTGLTGTEATAYSVADNRTSELAAWDDEALAATLRSLQSEDFDLAAVGFTADEVDELCGGLGDALAGGETPDDVTPPDEFPEKDEGIETDHECPRCGYKWSGSRPS